ncbi:MAG: HepT-like ribonuclease domain-containing protein [Halobacteriota archaeon]|nr:HepT-like ribonuclease domain-containing protein [Halobacteriota archaeon]
MSNKDKQNLLGILEAIEKIDEYISSFKNADEFFNHTINFDAAMMNFIIIGEMVERLTDQLKEANNHIDWIKIKGFRNLVAHDYFGIDAEEVWQIATTHLPQLKTNLKKILEEPDR